VILSEAGLVAYSGEWGCDDCVVADAGPVEVEVGLRQLIASPTESSKLLVMGTLVINEDAYLASIDGRRVDLTYTEFELLVFLATNPGRVFSREHLLSEVWGLGYYGGPRTVDVHVRRLRAKLGAGQEGLIETVRNVGYRFAARLPDSTAVAVLP
jgi:DNA-binding response OmpR family regulator